MKKMILTGLLVSMTVCGVAQAALVTEQSLSLPEAEEWITHYYQYKNSEKTARVFRSLLRNGVFERHDARSAMATVFLGSVFCQNSRKLDGWFAELKDLEPKDKLVFFKILGLSDCASNREFLKKLIARNQAPAIYAKAYLDTPPKDPLRVKIDDPQLIEVLRGMFFATGDERYVLKMIEPLAALNQPKNPIGLHVAHVAKTQLAKDAKLHPLILEICKREAVQATGAFKKALWAVIKEAEAVPPPGS